jgi:HAE1 family hydrophobic/amphiphilic exporter-1
MGCLPMALSFVNGPSGRQTLGITIVGGLMVSQLVTLYITPVFYIYLDRFHSQARKQRKTRIEEALA